jgi:hypothetical protein
MTNLPLIPNEFKFDPNAVPDADADSFDVKVGMFLTTPPRMVVLLLLISPQKGVGPLYGELLVFVTTFYLIWSYLKFWLMTKNYFPEMMIAHNKTFSRILIFHLIVQIILRIQVSVFQTDFWFHFYSGWAGITGWLLALIYILLYIYFRRKYFGSFLSINAFWFVFLIFSM